MATPQAALYGAGNPNVSDADIQAFIKANPDPNKIYQQALASGVSLSQVEKAMGGQGGFSQPEMSKWIAQNRGVVAPPPPTLLPQMEPTPTTITPEQMMGLLGQVGQQYPNQPVMPAQVALPPPITPMPIIPPPPVTFNTPQFTPIGQVSPIGTNQQVQYNPAQFTGMGQMQQVGQAPSVQYNAPQFAPIGTLGQIGNAPDVTYNAPSFTAPQYNPLQFEQGMSVGNQLGQILDPNSPLMQQQQTQALQQMGARGLLGSSLAVTAAQEAMIRQGVPIASQEAETRTRLGMTEAQLRNQSNLASAEMANQMAMESARGGLQASQATAGNVLQRNLTQGQLEAQRAIAQAELQNQVAMEASRGGLAASQANAANIQQRNLAIADLQNRRDTLEAELKNQMTLSNAQGGLTASQQNAANALQRNLAQADMDLRTAMANAEMQNQMSLATSQGQMQAQQATAGNLLQARIPEAANFLAAQQATQQGQLTAGLANVESMNQAQMFNEELMFKNRTFDTGIVAETVWRNMDNSTKMQAITLGAQYDNMLQSNADARRLYGQGLQFMAEIQASDRPNKQAELDNVVNYITNGMNLLRSMGNPDISQLLDFSKFSAPTASGATTTNDAISKIQNTSGQLLGADPNNAMVTNTVGGSMPTEVAERIRNDFGVDPRLTITDNQAKQMGLDAQLSQLEKEGKVVKIQLHQIIGQKQSGGLFGSKTKNILGPVDPAFNSMGLWVWYYPDDYLGITSLKGPAGGA